MLSTKEAIKNKWTEIFDNYEKSGLSGSKFCLKHEIPIKSFYSWRQKLRPELMSPALPKKFSEIKIKQPLLNVERSIKIIACCGTQLIIPENIDPKNLKAILSCLGN